MRPRSLSRAASGDRISSARTKRRSSKHSTKPVEGWCSWGWRSYGWIQKSFLACLRHDEVKDAKCGRGDRGKGEKARVETEVMHDGTGDDLAERGADADRPGRRRGKNSASPDRAASPAKGGLVSMEASGSGALFIEAL